MPSGVDIVVLAGGDRTLGMAALAGTGVLGAVVIAADAGVHLADAAGLSVDVAVGDFDSVDATRLAELDDAADRGDVELHRHPADKDAADLALALDLALDRAPTSGNRVLVAGVEGGRSDFALANQLLVASPRYRALQRKLALADARVWVIDDHLSLRPSSTTRLSVVPVHGPAVVSFVGVRWPLAEATLQPGTSWALGNEPVAEEVGLTVHEGTVLLFERAVRPGLSRAR